MPARNPNPAVPHEQLAAQELLASRVRRMVTERFDASCAIDVLTRATAGDFYLCGGTIRRGLLGGSLSGDLDIILPNGDDRAIDALDGLKVPFVLNSHGHRRYRWNALQIDVFQPRQFFRGFDGVEGVLRFFDLKVNALALHLGSGGILDPFQMLSQPRISDPGINWLRWTEMSPLDVVVLAIRLAKVMNEAPRFTVSPLDADRLRADVMPRIGECDWTEVHQRFPQGKDEFLRVFAARVLTDFTITRQPKPYDRLLSGERHRPSRLKGRTLEEEADADRGRVLFCAPFRRLQNKAQVFSLETNAAVRSRLTHSLEVSSIGRFVAQQAIKQFKADDLAALGIEGKERPLITFVETACLLHDMGNPPFGHFGEIAISDWFHVKADVLRPPNTGGTTRQLWDRLYADFRHFDGNPQGFRIATKLQPPDTEDLYGLNLTATTLAATLKYPWTSNLIGEARKKAGYFHTEEGVVDWICKTLGVDKGTRHPLVYLMEAADDIAYCVSDIEDGIEKGLIAGRDFSDYMTDRLGQAALDADDKDVKDMKGALELLRNPKMKRGEGFVDRLTPMQDFRSGVIRFLARHAGTAFQVQQAAILKGTAPPLLRDGDGAPLLTALKDFAEGSLYSSRIVRNREITAHAVLSGILDAYLPLMISEEARFDRALAGKTTDADGRHIARDSSLIGRISRKHLAVYREALRVDGQRHGDTGVQRVMERIYRIRLVVDYVSGMTDEFALQSFQLVSGVHVDPYRN
jgi:dGTPase